MLKRLFLALALIFGAAIPALAQTSEPACLPQTGVFTAIQEQGFLQAAIEELLSNSRGGTIPGVDCTGNPQEGQFWYNNNSPFAGFPGLGLYDLAAFVYLGFIDRTNHIWMPQLGGGIASIASASTVDPCSVPQDAISITGNTTITSFGSSCAVGQFKFIAFTASLSIEQSASLLTPGAASITTGAGDQAIIEYTGGGVWRVVFYAPNNGAAQALSLSGGTLAFSLSGPSVLNIPSGTHTPAMLDVPDQQATGGANITAYSNGIATSTFTPDCGKGPLQTLTNNGAFNFEPPSSDSSCVILISNGSSAGSVNFTGGWKEGSNIGDSLNTTSGDEFNIVITRIAGASHYLISALQ